MGALIDTDVLIEYLRGKRPAAVFLESMDLKPSVSVVSVAELYAGARNEDEIDSIERFLLAFDIIPVSADIARRGGLYRKEYAPSSGTGLADALIAATATVYGLRLFTFNVRHFPMVQDVRTPYSRN